MRALILQTESDTKDRPGGGRYTRLRKSVLEMDASQELRGGQKWRGGQFWKTPKFSTYT